MRKDLTGKIINNWEVLSIADKGKDKNTMYNCRCLCCGREYVVQGQSLSSGRSKMCRSCSASKCKRQKYTGDSICTIFMGMKERCYNKNFKHYDCYGGRGITICDEWLENPESFYDWAYENGYKKGLSIERIDVNKGYSPDNCTFITKAEQSINRRNVHLITYDGETKCLSEWCRIFHIGRGRVRNICKNNGGNWEKALETALS